MGLLTTIFGDDETKDELGQTQMDRRAPIWSGLLKTGAMLMAGGQPMSPEQRAKYIGEAGGALAEVPSNMIAQRSEMAKQQAAQQTIIANKTKLANQAKIQEMGKSPEAQAAMAKLDGTRRMAMQAAYDAGDIKSVVDILESTDRSALGAERLQLLTERQRQLAENAAGQHAVRVGQLDNSTKALELKQQEAERKRNEEFPGTAEAQVHARNLRGADPSSYAYYMAYQYFNRDQTDRDGKTMAKMDLTPFAPPTYRDPRAPAVDPATDILALGGTMEPGTVQKLSDGTKVVREIDGTVVVDKPDGSFIEKRKDKAPIRGARKPVPSDAMKVFSKNLEGIDKIEQLDQELEDHPNAHVGTLAAHILSRTPGTAGMQILNGIDPKGQKARNIIADLNSMEVHDRTGAAVGVMEYARFSDFIPLPSDTPAQVAVKIKGLKRAMDHENKLYKENLATGTRMPPQVSERYDPPTPGTYVMPDGSSHDWAKIEDAAKKRGISTNEMIRKYQMKRKE